jgi:DNA processing protein
MAGTGGSEELLRWIVLGRLVAANASCRAGFLRIYGSLEKAVRAGPPGWVRSGLLRPPEANDIFRAAFGRGGVLPPDAETDPAGAAVRWAERQVELAAEHGARIVLEPEEAYPETFRHLPDPPPVLYVLGDLGRIGPAVAVVGARKATRYGLAAARKLAADLAGCGLAIASGGARGIDSAAHEGALSAGGRTVAVLGAGLDRPYPIENARLFREIAGTGAVVTEFGFGAPPRAIHFPVRNRLIAALSLGVVVVEGTEGSGSMITAGLALEGGREVFAVPGHVDSALSEGPHRLILEGAKLVRRAQDVLDELPPHVIERLAALPLEAPEEPASARGPAAAVLAALERHEGRTLDAIAAEAGLAAPDVLALLTELEIQGLVEPLPGGRYARKG